VQDSKKRYPLPFIREKIQEAESEKLKVESWLVLLKSVEFLVR
jgi:hypothetical protein